MLERLGSNFITKPTAYTETVVGDELSASFKPHVRYKIWGEESWFSLRFPSSSTAPATVDGQSVQWTDGDTLVRFYELPQDGRADRGLFEFDVVFAARPAMASLDIPYESSGLDFYYQPALTVDELAQGNVRPAHVVGSYAAYHASEGVLHASPDKAEKYRAGKAFHLYRPEAIDATGARHWVPMVLDQQAHLLRLDLSEKWWDTAAYPVTLDPTLGYTSIGASTTSHAVSRGVCGRTAAASENGTATSISVYGQSTSGTCNYCMVLYDDNTTTGTRLDYGAEVGRSGAAAWNTDNVVVGYSLVAGTRYYVGHYHNASAAPGNMVSYYDTGTTNDGLIYNTAYSSPPPASATVASATANLYSAYVTYSTGRASKNTCAFPLGTEIGMGWRMTG